tara:strand:+ start:1695 stop:1880 length:186 start_codon:yes stop_codon:yes gene_type:complete
MDWDLSLENERLENMLTVYQDHIEVLEAENKDLRAKVLLLVSKVKKLKMEGNGKNTTDTKF